MSLGWKIAALNVLRNGRRSAITLAAIIFGCISLIVFGGFVHSMYEGMRESMIRSQLGHIQIYAEGFSQYGKAEPERYLVSLEQFQQVQTILEQQTPALAITPRLNFGGLLSDGKQSLPVMGVGVDADNEVLLSSAINIVEGSDLFPDDAAGAQLGEGLFRSLDVKVGDYLTLLSSTADGAINAVDIQIAGVINTGVKELDDRVVRVNLAYAQDLLYTSKMTRIVILLNNTSDTELVVETLRQAFDEQNLQLEIKSWFELADFYHQVVSLFDGVFGFVTVIVLIIVALSISNTMLMSVMERTREIGTIRALGGTPLQVVRMILMEATVLGIIGCLFGILLGMLAAKGITYGQWMMPTPPGSTQDYPIRVFIVPEVLIYTALLALVITIASSLYPAIKAARLSVAGALRYT